KMLQHTCYYFRLGAHYQIGPGNPGQTFELSEGGKPLVIEPGSFAHVESLEVFTLSAKVLAMFGTTSDLASEGLHLSHSPFIDPLFDGRLKIGIWNHTPGRASLRFGDRIGKVAFFDISDTYPITRPSDDSIIGETFQRRRPLYDDHPAEG